MNKFTPVVYIASAYTKGDTAINVRFQSETFDRLLSSGLVIPVAPLWSHAQHMMFPRPYEDWIKYDNALIPLYDACVRLTSEYTPVGYRQGESSGADNEASLFRSLGKPVFLSIDSVYDWVRNVRALQGRVVV